MEHETNTYRNVRLCALVAAALFAPCAWRWISSARVQNVSAAMLGQVTDRSGASVSGAEVKITRAATSRATRPTSRAAGFDPFTETKQEYDARAQWFRDAKFGVFIHWNPSSLVGTGISWCRDKVGREKYDALYKEFKGEKFNAEEWVRLFHEAGIRYAVIVPKHHDGFCMFDTKTSDYKVMHSPFGRDYVKEMADACAKSDVRFCLYYSVLDWWNPAYSGKAGADLTKYKNEVFKPHMQELLTKYGPVGYIWFDGNVDDSWTHADGREMYAFTRRQQPATLLGNRIEPRVRNSEGKAPYWHMVRQFLRCARCRGRFSGPRARHRGVLHGQGLGQLSEPLLRRCGLRRLVLDAADDGASDYR